MGTCDREGLTDDELNQAEVLAATSSDNGAVSRACFRLIDEIGRLRNCCSEMKDHLAVLEPALAQARDDRDEWKRRAEVLRAELEAMTESRDAERLRYGQQRARCAIFMQAMVDAARDGRQEWSHACLKAADEAARSVRLEDFRSIIGGKP